MKKYKSVIMVVTSVLFLSACSAPKTMFPISGSRADGVVKMAYHYDQFEKPIINEKQARRDAVKKCQTWGYDSAEAFGGQYERCVKSGAWGSCGNTEVVVEYQCLGDLGGL